MRREETMASSNPNTNTTDSDSDDDDDSNKFITVFACDICKNVRFRSAKEAEEHEKTCTDYPSDYDGGRRAATAAVADVAQQNARPPPPPPAPVPAARGERGPVPPALGAPVGRGGRLSPVSHANPLVPNPIGAPAVALQPTTMSAGAAATGAGAASKAAPPSASNNAASKTAPPSASNNATVATTAAANHPPSDGIINKTLFKCRKCKLLFWTTKLAASHEKNCRESQWYNCSVCQVLRFRSREERTVHERTCPGLKPLRMADLPLAERLVGSSSSSTSAGTTTPATKLAVAPSNAAGSAVDQVERADSVGGSQAIISKEAEKTIGAIIGNEGASKKIGSIIDMYKKQVRQGQGQGQGETMAGIKAAWASPAQSQKSGDIENDKSDSSSDVQIMETSKSVAQPKSVSNQGEQSKDPPKINNDAVQAKGTDAQKKQMEWTTVWTCDICHQEQFDCFEDAVAHEKICQGKAEGPQDPSSSSPTKKDSQNVSKTANTAAPAPTSARSPTNANPSPSKLSTPKNKPTAAFLKDSLDSSKHDPKIATTVASAPSPIIPSPSPSKSSPSTNKPASKIMLFSPILKDSSDSTNYTQISKYHRLLLKSLQLLHRPATSGGAISFKCHFCSQTLPPNKDDSATTPHWTLKTIAETLPSKVMKHITNECKSVPTKEGTQLPMAKSSGKMPFDEFLSGFFSENGIVEKQDGRGVVVLPEEEFQKMPGSERSKRGMQLKGGKKKRGRAVGSKNATTTKRRKSKTDSSSEKSLPRSKHKNIKYGDMGCKMHIEDGTQFCLGPLDGLPFLSSFSREASKKLHPSEKFLLQQLELFDLSPKLMESANMKVHSQTVGIRCRNCIADKNGCCFMKLSSVNNISIDVLLMATEHVVSCRFMKAKDVKVVQELKAGDRGWLAKYCNWIAKLYCLEDSKDESSGVVWGESPKVPKGYSTLADVDVSLVLGKPMPDLEAESPPPKIVEKARPPLSKVVEEVEMSTIAPPPPPPMNSAMLTDYHRLLCMGFVIVPSFLSPTSGKSTLAIASFKCKHCKKILGSPESFEQMTTLLLQFPSHSETCFSVPLERREELAKCKTALGSTQLFNIAGTDLYVQYVKKLCTNVYGMAEMHDPNKSSYLGFTNVDDLHKEYGTEDSGSSKGVVEVEKMFSLPLIRKLF